MIPIFFKTHHAEIAELIRQEYCKGNAETRAAIGTLAIKFSAHLAHDNANFNREKFMRECGIE